MGRYVEVTPETVAVTPDGLLTCLKCGWQWRNKSLDLSVLPRTCASKKCHSPWWNVAKKEKPNKEESIKVIDITKTNDILVEPIILATTIPTTPVVAEQVLDTPPPVDNTVDLIPAPVEPVSTISIEPIATLEVTT